ncbi:MAG TPA: hypothetical protein VNO79_15480 [Actinomycetota bacterium]|nr:hypothetical protein [Actinomycetota bacterium]
MSDAYGRFGLARTYAMIFGVAYLGVALTEVLTRDALAPVLEFTVAQNAIHWAVGALVLGSFFAGEGAARLVARIVGVVFVLVTALGVLAPRALGDLLGYPGGIPVSYNVVHALTAIAALYAGLATRPARSAA